MNRFRFAAYLAFGCTLILASATRAQQPFTADAFYSAGIEAYFRGCSAEAESQFSSLMAVDPNDPRAFYFRALSLMRQGRADEARSDMEIGAEIESRSPLRFDIGKTLERIQGPNRLILEKYRNHARQLAGASPPVGPSRAPDAGVLRERRFVPLDEFARPGVPQSTVVRPTFSEPAPALPPTAVKPVDDATPIQPNPFADDSATAEPKQKPTPPPAKAAAPPAKAPLPPAPKPAPPVPKVEAEDPGNPF